MVRDLEADLGYDVEEHIKKLEQKCGLLIGDNHSTNVLTLATGLMRELVQSRQKKDKRMEIITEALVNQEEDALDYLKNSIFSLEESIYDLYEMVGLEKDLNFLQEY